MSAFSETFLAAAATDLALELDASEPAAEKPTSSAVRGEAAKDLRARGVDGIPGTPERKDDAGLDGDGGAAAESLSESDDSTWSSSTAQKQRRETAPSTWYSLLAAVPVYAHTLVIPSSMFLLIAELLLYPVTWTVGMAYGIIILLDRRAENGLALQTFQLLCRRCVWWRLFAAYFPVRLHKTVDLAPSDPPLRRPTPFFEHTITLLLFLPFVLVWKAFKYFQDGAQARPHRETSPHSAAHDESSVPKSLQPGKKYIFAVSPHGIISMGAFCAIGTEGCGWSKLFPGVMPRLLTIGTCFLIPFYRQYALLTGCASVSRRSCLNLLHNNQSICIIIGGTRESLLTRPGTFDLILRCRRGIIRIALETGASLVPVLSFGENDIYNAVPQSKDSFMYKFNSLLARKLGFAFPKFVGRGFLSEKVGLVPFRRPINVVVGKPIDVPLMPEYTSTDVDAYQQLYIDSLIELFESNVDKYTPGVELRIVE